MLDPGIQTVLADALRPPEGTRVDQAVATTYSLNLTAMLLAPLAFALADPEGAEDLHRDPFALLDAVQRHIGHTTVFVQAGGIAVPRSHSRIFTFLEDSVVPVEPPSDQGVFHPKVWAVRFVHDDGTHRHRLLIGSRNLTLDDSWDTLLVLDEDPDGPVDGGPAADFVAALPGMALDEMPGERRSAVLALADSLRHARFAVPAPFTDGRLLPLGLAGENGHALDELPSAHRVRRTLAITPFATADVIVRLRGGTEPLLLSRPEQLDLLGPAGCEGWDTRVLHDDMTSGLEDAPADGVLEGETEQSEAPDSESSLRSTGLHAKTVVMDLLGQRERSLVVTGSANLSRPAWTRNVEFNAVLQGPTRTCGVAAALEPRDGGVGLDQVMTRYAPAEPDADLRAQIAGSLELERFHRAVAAASPTLVVTAQGEDEVRGELAVVVPQAPEGAVTTARLLTLQADAAVPLADGTAWTVAPKNVTPFLVLENRLGSGEAKVTRRCLVTLRLEGDLTDRRQAYLEELLDSESAVLRYLALLLGIDEHAPGEDLAAEAEALEQLDGLGEGGHGGAWTDVVLFEPLMRASVGDVDALAAVAGQVAALRRSEKVRALIPAEFEQMWDTVLSVVAPDVLALSREERP
ncbi:hypothetical protein HMPREF2863_10595 [Micrococcus sp. HMSC067E09]|uniref:phospholipase D-like domain-containing protein n=1 Tax=Micrococcus sp. HMSC067E09 TaxID=1739367 RepID=UPI0008A29826|nr:phospholipase D-like domain-containing protein [Micrococcus sp. HMSC067E09]OFR88752.1 hypothetical protein HMPREF2863_10595 [Micrococcus sp. HMSC067E09]